MAGITLTNSAVNGGTAVTLPTARINYAWKNLFNVDPIAMKYGLREADKAGFENPTIVVTGTMDVDDVAANELTEKLLKKFAQAQTTDTTLTITIGSSDTAITDYSGTAGETSIKVFITNFNLIINPTAADYGHIVRYTINLKETA